MYSFNSYRKKILELINSNENIISIENSQLTLENREIYALKLGKGVPREIISAGVHGREWINTWVLIKIISAYCEMYKQDYIYNGIRIQRLLSDRAIIFVPLVNPDGYEIALWGNDVEWKNNARDVDINRNFYCKSWVKKYKNDYPFSEIETLFLKKIFDKYRADIYLDIHSRGENIYYYRRNMPDKYNDIQLNIAREISKLTGYRCSLPIEEINEGDSGGNTVHYYSEYIKNSAITIETVHESEQFPLDCFLIDKVYSELLYVPLYLLATLLQND